MPNKAYMRETTVTTSYAPLEAAPTVVTVDITCPPANTGNVTFKDEAGNEVPWIPGEWHHMVNVDLSKIQIKGTAGDKVTVVGGDH